MQAALFGTALENETAPVLFQHQGQRAETRSRLTAPIDRSFKKKKKKDQYAHWIT